MSFSLELIIAATILGGVWRVMLGGWLGLPRGLLMAIGGLMAAGITYINTHNFIFVGLATGLTLFYFSIGNGAVLGKQGTFVDYLKIYIGPSLLAVILALDGYNTPVEIAGVIAAAGYYAFWQPFTVNASPWNIKAEALMGASWFGLLAVNLG